MKIQTNTINQYVKISNEISDLENTFLEKRNEFENQYTAEYTHLKKELSEYVTKMQPMVTTLCNLYHGKVELYNGRIWSQGDMLCQKFDGINACEVAIKLGANSIKSLTAILKKINIDDNLRQFAIEYNTVVEIYVQIERLKEQAIFLSMEVYENEVLALHTKRSKLCKDEKEFKQLINYVKQNSNLLYDKVIINDAKELEKAFVTEIMLPVGYEICPKNIFDGNIKEDIVLSILEWDLSKNGILVIKSDNQNIDSTELLYCVVNTIIQFLFSYPTTNKKILICDSCSSNTITTFTGILKDGNTELFFDNANNSYTKNTSEEIRKSLTELNKMIHQRIMMLGQSHCTNTLEYNKENQDNPMPIILVLLSGYPFKYENTMDDLSVILKNGKDAGVFFLITENAHTDEDDKFYYKRLPALNELTKNIVDFQVVEGKGHLNQNDKSYFSNTCGQKYSMSAILSVFKTSIKNTMSSIVYLDSVVEKEDFASSVRRRKYSKTLSIPFGKQGSNSISIDLSADNSNAHLAIIGTTGTGKSAFMNSLILSACKLYSPLELEFHLIVMIKGGFKIFEEQSLPHLKTIVTGDRIFAANDVLDFIDEEMKRRGALIGSYDSIYAYNEVALKPLPRCVIMIDEFYQLIQGSDNAVERITRVAQLGRAYGISLVVSSIHFPMELNSIIPLFGNRIEFKSEENAGQLIPQAANRQGELEGTNGLCFFAHGGDMYRVAVAYSEEGEKLKQHVQEVKNKYPDYKMELSSEIKTFKIYQEKDVPFTTKSAKVNYTEDGIIRVRLGKTYLFNKNLEYLFDSKNNVLFLFGHYLDTKMVEVSLIKDTLVLSKNIDEPTIYYIDYQNNATLKRANTIIKRLLNDWVLLDGKMIYSGYNEAENTLNDIEELVENRETDESCELYPILIIIAKADELFSDDDKREMLCNIISRGKENNVYFAIQCNEPVRFYGSEKYINDAIIFPDRYREGDDSYSSTALCAALEAMPAGATDKGRKLRSTAEISALHPKLHILCDNNKIFIFIPYEYDDEYLKKINK